MLLHMLFMVMVMTVTLLVPLGIGIYLGVKHKGIGIYLAGAATFVVTQILFRMPLLYVVLPQFSWYLRLQLDPVWYALFLSSTAGLVEEGGRLLTMGWLHRRQLKKAKGDSVQVLSKDLLSPMGLRQGLVFGLGHGGIEAMLLVGINALASLFLWQQVSGTLALGSPFIVLVGGIERILAVTFHVGASLMILYGIRMGKPIRWTVAAMLAHTVLNFTAVLAMQALPGKLALVEALIGLQAVAVLCISIWLWVWQWRQSNDEKTYKE